jgi:hypothetical protein
MEEAILELAGGPSAIQRMLGRYRPDTRRYQKELASLRRQKAKFLADSTARNASCLNALLHAAAEAASVLRQLNDTLAAGYATQYQSAHKDAEWSGIDTGRFATPTELQTFIQRHEDRFCSLAPSMGAIARRAAIPVDLVTLKLLDSYPVFKAELGSHAKTAGTPERVTEQATPARPMPPEKSDNGEPGKPDGAPRPIGRRLSKRQLAVLGGLVIGLLGVFSCLAALIVMTRV